MKIKDEIWIILVGILVGVISYWFQPYDQMKVFGIHFYILMSSGAFLGSFLLTYLMNKIPSTIALFVSLGVILAVILRMIYDISFWDSTSHNLAPIEIMLYGFITVPSAFVGVYLAQLIKSLTLQQKKRN